MYMYNIGIPPLLIASKQTESHPAGCLTFVHAISWHSGELKFVSTLIGTQIYIKPQLIKVFIIEGVCLVESGKL